MTFPLFIYSLDRKIFDGEAVSLTIPGRGGQLQILAGHTPLVALLTEGDIAVEKEDHSTQTLPVGGGVLQVTSSKAVVLVHF